MKTATVRMRQSRALSVQRFGLLHSTLVKLQSERCDLQKPRDGAEGQTF